MRFSFVDSSDASDSFVETVVIFGSKKACDDTEAGAAVDDGNGGGKGDVVVEGFTGNADSVVDVVVTAC